MLYRLPVIISYNLVPRVSIYVDIKLNPLFNCIICVSITPGVPITGGSSMITPSESLLKSLVGGKYDSAFSSNTKFDADVAITTASLAESCVLGTVIRHVAQDLGSALSELVQNRILCDIS